MAEAQYRYERKFVIENGDLAQIEALIFAHPALFNEIYQGRFINNIYLDSYNYQAYYDNVTGVSERRKFRLRWYGDSFREAINPSLEVKCKKAEVGTKLVYNLPSFTLENAITIDSLLSDMRADNLPEEINCTLNMLQFSFINRYYRRYYRSADGRYRLTLDSKLAYAVVDSCRITLPVKWDRPPKLILELKYDRSDNADADRISNFFQYRLSKSSKYISGIERWAGIL